MSDLVCPACGSVAASGPGYPPHCACGALWSMTEAGAPPHRDRVTPVTRDPHDPAVWWKREDQNPTGSFKDRGAEALARVARVAGARHWVLDSSGSAALAAARAAALHDARLALHVPASLSPGKHAVLRSLGAHVTAEGSRADAAARARAAAKDAFWFSHVFHPAFAHGVSGAVEEILAGLGADMPRTWLVPVGNGSLLLGLARGLVRNARGDVRLVAVQPAAVPGLREPGRGGVSQATGAAIADPPRRTEILAAVESSGGEVRHATEEEILAAEVRLARRGMRAEPAAALAEAAAAQLRAEGSREPLLGWLTGSGSRDG